MSQLRGSYVAIKRPFIGEERNQWFAYVVAECDCRLYPIGVRYPICDT